MMRRREREEKAGRNGWREGGGGQAAGEVAGRRGEAREEDAGGGGGGGDAGPHRLAVASTVVGATSFVNAAPSRERSYAFSRQNTTGARVFWHHVILFYQRTHGLGVWPLLVTCVQVSGNATVIFSGSISWVIDLASDSSSCEALTPKH